ncbi:MAG: DUF2842 domain-containing protein [Pseudomonadota bacterium]|jgi:hypothetical protein
MTPRTRKFVGMVAILAFLLVYVGIAAFVGERLPQHWLVLMLYYGLVGTLWGVPLFPLIRWMNRGS